MQNIESGQQNSYDFLGQNVEEFKKWHIAFNDDPCKNYELSEIDSKEIEKIRERMLIEKDYKTTTYASKRKDGSKFMIAQVGEYEKNGKDYYRYLYADILNDGKITNQILLVSKTNVGYFINERNFGRKVSDGYGDAVSNILFSKENIKDSLSRGTSYIGQIQKERSDNKFELVSEVSEIIKGEDDIVAQNFPEKRITRDDGSSLVIQQVTKNVDVNCYYIYEIIKDEGRYAVKGNVVYSEQDLLNDKRKEIANDLLSRDRIDRKAIEAGGYIGYYDPNGIKTYNPNLLQYFKLTESERTEIKSKQRKMQWVKQFIKDYEATENGTEFSYRIKCEDDNIKRVVNSIKSGNFFEDFDNNATSYNYNSEWFMEKLIVSMARLLKEADNLTIDGSMDYLEKFVSIPKINKILLKIKASEQSKQMHEKAEENRRTGNLPKYLKTRVEIDKQYAQDYLRNRNVNESFIKKEIEYRKGLTRNSVIIVSDEKDISLLRKQQTSLTRVLARQDGKIPSEVLYDEKRKIWYCITDTQAKQNKCDMVNTNFHKINSETIIRDTQNIGLQEIRDLENITKQLQANSQQQQVLRDE